MLTGSIVCYQQVRAAKDAAILRIATAPERALPMMSLMISRRQQHPTDSKANPKSNLKSFRWATLSIARTVAAGLASTHLHLVLSIACR